MSTVSTQHLARAYVDGRLYDSTGWGGVRVAVRFGEGRPVARLLEAHGEDARLARLIGIEEALLLAKELGARCVVVFCDDESVVRQLDGTEEVPQDALGWHLRVRALMNQFRKATVLHASTAESVGGASALEGFSAAEVCVLGRPRNLSLFPALA